MFTYSERDMHRMPAPMRTHLPVKQDITKSGIMEDDMTNQEAEVNTKRHHLYSCYSLDGLFLLLA